MSDSPIQSKSYQPNQDAKTGNVDNTENLSTPSNAELDWGVDEEWNTIPTNDLASNFAQLNVNAKDNQEISAEAAQLVEFPPGINKHIKVTITSIDSIMLPIKKACFSNNNFFLMLTG